MWSDWTLALAIWWIPYKVHDLRRQSSISNNHYVHLLGSSPSFPHSLQPSLCWVLQHWQLLVKFFSNFCSSLSPVVRFALQTTMSTTVAFNCLQNLVCHSTWYTKIVQYVAGNSKNFGIDMPTSVVCSCSCTHYKSNYHQAFLVYKTEQKKV